MIGRVGTIFGAHGINISSAAVGHTPHGAPSAEGGEIEGGGEAGGAQRSAAMVVTTDVLVPREVVAEIVASEGFLDGWSVVLS
jgi:hypothetical protein